MKTTTKKREWQITYSLIGGMKDITYAFVASDIMDAFTFIENKFDGSRFENGEYLLEFPSGVKRTFKI